MSAFGNGFMQNRFLAALKNQNRGRPPVWLMRQAGRYLPEYRALREKYSLRDLFFTPELAADVTLMPVERFGVDAAILFSDITAIAPALGLKLSFDEGPVVDPWITPGKQLRIDATQLEPIYETVRLVKQKTAVPLIGFCGGPFTVASYLIERHDGRFESVKRWLKEGDLQPLIDLLTDVSISYLRGQIAAGADAIQIFDSWANTLVGDEFHRYSLDPIRKIVEAVDRPVIVFMRGSAKLAALIETTGAAAISVDWDKPLPLVRQEVRSVLQGNLDPDYLFQSPAEVSLATRRLLEEMRGDPGFIVNLGHGVKVGTPIESVAAMIDTVKQWT